MQTPKATTSLSVIKKWAEQRGGRPAWVKHTSKKEGSLLRIQFPETISEREVEIVPWDVWYEVFLNSKMEFQYQDRTLAGEKSYRFKLIDRTRR